MNPGVKLYGCMTSQQGTGDPCWNELPAFCNGQPAVGTVSIYCTGYVFWTLDSDLDP